jgi:hypothetical protein
MLMSSKPRDGAVLTAPDAYDPENWITRTVPIIPKSEQYVPVTDHVTGMPIFNPQTGKIRAKLVTFNDDDLDKIISKANQKMATKNFSLVHIHHTDSKTPANKANEKVGGDKKGKLVVGFLRNHRKGILYDENGKVIDDNPHWLADMVIRKDLAEEAFKYPHRSPEIDPNTMTLDSLALTDEPPKYHMGLIMNARYIDADPSVDLEPPGWEGDDPMADEMQDEESQDTPLTARAFAEGLAELAQPMHQLLAIMQEKFSAPPEEEGEPGEGEIHNEGAGEGDIMNEAGTSPGPGNAMMPDYIPSEDEIKNCGNPHERMLLQNRRDLFAVAENSGGLGKRLAKLESENKFLKDQLAELQDANGQITLQNCRQIVDGHMTEIERDYEVPPRGLEKIRRDLTAAFAEGKVAEELEETLATIQNARRPMNVGFVPSARGGQHPKDGPVSPKTLNKIQHFAQVNGLSWFEAKAQYLAKNPA